jgi:hypothetical protein
MGAFARLVSGVIALVYFSYSTYKNGGTPGKHKIGAAAIFVILPLVVWGITQVIMKNPTISSSMDKIMPLYNALNQDRRYSMTGVSLRENEAAYHS